MSNEQKNTEIKAELLPKDEEWCKTEIAKEEESSLITCISTFLSAVKIAVLTGTVVYFWIWTAAERAAHFGVLQQMCLQHRFPAHLIFHHDRLLDSASFNSNNSTAELSAHAKSIRKEMARAAVGHFPQGPKAVKVLNKTSGATETTYPLQAYVYHKDGTVTPDPKNILSSDVWDAAVRIGHAELGDKTFLLLVTLTVAWATWHNDDAAHNHAGNEDELGDQKRIYEDHADGAHSHGHITGHQVNPGRIIVASTIGVVAVNVKSILWQKGIYANEVRLFVSIVLVVLLVNYMFTICTQHLENLTALQKLKKEEDTKDDRAQRDGLVAAYQAKEERKRTIRKLQRQLTISSGLLEEGEGDGLQKKLSLTDLDITEEVWKSLVDGTDRGQTPGETQEPQIRKQIITVDQVEEGEDKMDFEEKDKEQNDDDHGIQKEKGSFSDQLQVKPNHETKEDQDGKKKIEKEAKYSKMKKYVIYLLKKFWADIIFLFFMFVQEVDDTSFLKTIELRAVFTQGTLVNAVILAHITMNIVVVLIVYLLTGLLMSQNETSIFGCLAIYFICSYEFLLHILRWGAVFMGLSFGQSGIHHISS